MSLNQSFQLDKDSYDMFINIIVYTLINNVIKCYKQAFTVALYEDLSTEKIQDNLT